MKKILSILIALIFALSCFSCAFAANEGEIIVTDYEGETETYKYAGTLKEGSNDVDILKPDKYKVFMPDKSGVYSFGGEAMSFIPESVSGNKASGCKQTPYAYEKSYYHFEAGEPQYIFFYGAEESNANTADCVIEYLGEPKKLICKNDSVSLLGINIYYDKEYDIYYIEYDFELTFTESDEKANLFLAETKTPVKSGDNSVEIEMLGNTFSINLNVRSIEEYIKGFELPENYTNTGYLLYNGNVIAKYPKYVTVLYTDGSSEQLPVRYDGIIEINIPGLRVLYPGITYDEGHMTVHIAEKDYYLGADAKKAGIFLNTIELLSSIKNDIFATISFAAMLLVVNDYESAFNEIQAMKKLINEDISMYKVAVKS